MLLASGEAGEERHVSVDEESRDVAGDVPEVEDVDDDLMSSETTSAESAELDLFWRLRQSLGMLAVRLSVGLDLGVIHTTDDHFRRPPSSRDRSQSTSEPPGGRVCPQSVSTITGSLLIILHTLSPITKQTVINC